VLRLSHALCDEFGVWYNVPVGSRIGGLVVIVYFELWREGTEVVVFINFEENRQEAYRPVGGGFVGGGYRVSGVGCLLPPSTMQHNIDLSTPLHVVVYRYCLHRNHVCSCRCLPRDPEFGGVAFLPTVRKLMRDCIISHERNSWPKSVSEPRTFWT
jgi:hypothetical protein